MKHWKISFIEIFGRNTYRQHTVVNAESFDEAIKIARKSDERYNTGQVMTEEEYQEFLEDFFS
jgi:hypothetical protein